jgi:hypothetical protein
MHLDRRTHLVQTFATLGSKQRKGVAALLQAHRPGRRNLQLDILGRRLGCKPVLHCRQPRPMLRRIRINPARIQTLTEHQHRLAIGARISRQGRKLDISGQRCIARDLLPNEVEAVRRRHILAPEEVIV